MCAETWLRAVYRKRKCSDGIFFLTWDGVTAHAAWWNEEFPIQVDNNEGIMTFVVWERIGEDWR